MKMRTMNRIDKYKKIAPKYTKNELADILGVKPKTVVAYRKQTGIKFKLSGHDNRTLDDWKEQFEKVYHGQLKLLKIWKTSSYGVSGIIYCPICHRTMVIKAIRAKIRKGTRCPYCYRRIDNSGNQFSAQQVINKLNSQCADHWILVKYGHYSQKDNIIRCQYCGYQQRVNLSDFINTTTMRCVHCETGSFGEFIIKTCLQFNHIPFKQEYTISGRHKYRIDFLIDHRIAIEYNGMQHYDPTHKQYQAITQGMKAKRNWCKTHHIKFIEIKYDKRASIIINRLNTVLGMSLRTPTPEFYKAHNPDIVKVLDALKIKSSRKVMEQFHIPVTKLRYYVMVDGCDSISQWQSIHCSH